MVRQLVSSVPSHVSHLIFSILLDTTCHALPQFDKIRILQPLNDLVRPQMGYGLSRAGASEWGEYRDGRMHAPVPPDAAGSCGARAEAAPCWRRCRRIRGGRRDAARTALVPPMAQTRTFVRSQ